MAWLNISAQLEKPDKFTKKLVFITSGVKMWNEKEQKMLLDRSPSPSLVTSGVQKYCPDYFDLKLIIANILVVSGVTAALLQQTSPVSSTSGVLLFDGLFCRTPWS